MPLDQALFDAGLKLQGAIPIEEVAVPLPHRAGSFTQLIVLAHAGPDYFDQTVITGEHPLDDRAIQLFESFMGRLGCTQYEILYPVDQTLVDLRKLGESLGWQCDSHLGLGIHPMWGTWFAYRLVALANTRLPSNSPAPILSPCLDCIDKPCLDACPASATGTEFLISHCSEERLRAASSCDSQCLAREACPVGKEHQYGREQIEFHARYSLQALRAHFS